MSATKATKKAAGATKAARAAGKTAGPVTGRMLASPGRGETSAAVGPDVPAPGDPGARGGTEKVSVTIDRALLAEARAVGPNLSATLNEALRRYVRWVRLGELLRELQAEHGPVPADVQAEVEAEWRPILAELAKRGG